jgi:predicted ATP-binding protein involved in virulence
MTTDTPVELLEVNIQGYRSCRNTAFSPHPKLSVLIGINGAGKTTLLGAIRLLKATTSRGIHSRPDEDKAGNPTVITAWFGVGASKVGLRLHITLGTSARNSDEIVAIDERWNFQSITGQRGWKNLPDFFWVKDRSSRVQVVEHVYQKGYPRVWISSNRFAQSPISQLDLDLLQNDTVRGALQAIAEFRAGINYYSASQFTDPTRCPSNFEIDEDERLAEPYGASKAHLKFIHDLYRLKSSSPELYEVFSQFVARTELGLVSRITWKEIELSSTTGEVKSGKIKKTRKTKTLVIPKVQIGSTYMTFNQLSEGTFKTLALTFYIMTDASKCLLIEEPEVCVHHGLLTKIVGTIKAYSRGKQIIFSTHSDQVLDQVSPENVFVVEMKKSGTTSTALENWIGRRGKKALHEYLNETGTLGEYWRAGGLS